MCLLQIRLNTLLLDDHLICIVLNFIQKQASKQHFARAVGSGIDFSLVFSLRVASLSLGLLLFKDDHSGLMYNQLDHACTPFSLVNFRCNVFSYAVLHPSLHGGSLSFDLHEFVLSPLF